MKFYRVCKLLFLTCSFTLSALSHAQATSRGTVVVCPVIYDQSGTDTSRVKAKEAIVGIFRKGGFGLVAETKALGSWKKLGFRTPTMKRPPTTEQLVSLGKSVGARYVCTSSINFRTRSIWVNLGPKTISDSQIAVTIVDTTTGKIAYEGDGEGRSDEKTDNLKVAGALLITPLVTVVSGGPKTPQETRAAQIAAARALEKFIVVD